jgi:hypothetical protein
MEDTKCFEKKFQEKELILQFFKRFMYFFSIHKLSNTIEIEASMRIEM